MIRLTLRASKAPVWLHPDSISAVSTDTFYNAGRSRITPSGFANVLCDGHWLQVTESPERVLVLMEKTP